MRETIALSNLLCERRHQDDKWGEQNHQPAEWLMILGEEVGEANKAVLESQFGGKDIINYRNEMVQVAAVALAAVEAFDRGKWKNNDNGGEMRTGVCVQRKQFKHKKLLVVLVLAYAFIVIILLRTI